MTRQEAFEFIQMYREFVKTGLSILEVSKPGSVPQPCVLLQFPDESEAWKSDWYAAKVIEAMSADAKAEEGE